MLETEKEKVYFEYCVSCSTHSWCTRHDESKYSSYFDRCRSELLQHCSGVVAVANQIPLYFRKQFASSTVKAEPWAGKNTFPRIGAFEVYFRDSLVFSKLSTGKWPSASQIAERIHEIIHKPPTKKPNIRKKARKIMSCKRVKVTRHKKKRKRRGFKGDPHSQLIVRKSKTPDDTFAREQHVKSGGKNLFRDLDLSLIHI